MSPLLAWSRQVSWPILQRDTRGWSGCFGFTLNELSRSPSSYSHHVCSSILNITILKFEFLRAVCFILCIAVNFPFAKTRFICKRAFFDSMLNMQFRFFWHFLFWHNLLVKLKSSYVMRNSILFGSLFNYWLTVWHLWHLLRLRPKLPESSTTAWESFLGKPFVTLCWLCAGHTWDEPTQSLCCILMGLHLFQYWQRSILYVYSYLKKNSRFVKYILTYLKGKQKKISWKFENPKTTHFLMCLQHV